MTPEGMFVAIIWAAFSAACLLGIALSLERIAKALEGRKND